MKFVREDFSYIRTRENVLKIYSNERIIGDKVSHQSFYPKGNDE